MPQSPKEILCRALNKLLPECPIPEGLSSDLDAWAQSWVTTIGTGEDGIDGFAWDDQEQLFVVTETPVPSSRIAVGESAWFMRDNRPTSKVVGAVQIVQTLASNGDVSGSEAVYSIPILNENGSLNVMLTLKDPDVFPTKEELLESL